MRTVLIAALLALVVSGAALPGALRAAADGDAVACAQTGLTFRPPLRLGTGRGYEPGIEIDSKGTVFVTAHKFGVVGEGVVEDARGTSWLWRSTDDGKTFQDVPLSPDLQVQPFAAFEGDFAVDGKDRLYFVDTWLLDNHFHRYGENGGRLESYRPAIPSIEIDDRPWLAAHHDGYVYYLSNNGFRFPQGRLTVHRSTDAGENFDSGYNLPESGWGFIDADPNSDYVYVFVHNDGKQLYLFTSPDRGKTWERSAVTEFKVGANQYGFPNIAVSPVDGSLAALWADGPNSLYLGRSSDHGATWDISDVTPFPGRYGHPWVTFGPTGDIGIIFEADPKAVAANTTFVYGMVWREASGCVRDTGATCAEPSLVYGRLDQQPTRQLGSQAHFFQVEMSADNALHVPWTGKGFEIFYTKQTGGPNLTGAGSCGVVGAP